jgi:hypothetical protein
MKSIIPYTNYVRWLYGISNNFLAIIIVCIYRNCSCFGGIPFDFINNFSKKNSIGKTEGRKVAVDLI